MTPGLRGFYEGTDGTAVRRLPRNVDPKQDGTRLAAHRPVIFEVGEQPDSVPIGEFDRRMARAVPQDVLKRIDHVIEAGTLLASTTSRPCSASVAQGDDLVLVARQGPGSHSRRDGPSTRTGQSPRR